MAVGAEGAGQQGVVNCAKRFRFNKIQNPVIKVYFNYIYLSSKYMTVNIPTPGSYSKLTKIKISG